MSSAIFGVLFCGVSTTPLLAITLPTQTTLTVSAPTVAARTPVTLTATVVAYGAPAMPGQVVFCVATAKYCEDLNLLGTAQVTSAGTASVKVLLTPGTHEIYAKFLGTTKFAKSTSLPSKQTVNVTGQLPSAAIVSTSGGPGNYTLTSTVEALGTVPPSGTVSFTDYSSLKTVATASLDVTTRSSSFIPTSLYEGKTFESQAEPPEGLAAIADLNGDGYPDVATISSPDSVTVQLANPANPGTFLASTFYTVGAQPIAVAIGDFNQDGTLDIVVANEDSTVSILSGDPAHPGTFLPHQEFPCGGAFAVTVADFNGDGLPDIAVASFVGPYSAYVLFNDAAAPGQFLPPIGFAPQKEGGVAVAAGDFNGDSLIDLAVANYTLPGVEILLNDPASPGHFGPPVSYGRGTPDAVAVADFNGDGVPDLAVGSFNDGDELDVLLGDPAHPGQFLAPTELSPEVFGAGSSVVTGDFNGDGLLDVATTNRFANGNPNSLAVFFADPAHSGKFLPEQDFGNPEFHITSSDYLAAADLNGDGVSDLVVPGLDEYYLLREISVSLGTVTETATASAVLTDAPSYISATYLGDQNYRPSASCDISFPAPSRPSSPVIGTVTLSNVTTTSATVNWTTNVPTYGGVDWGTDASFDSTGFYEFRTPWVSKASLSHSFVIKSFAPGSYYDYRVFAVSYFSGCDHWTTLSPRAFVPVVAAK